MCVARPQFRECIYSFPLFFSYSFSPFLRGSFLPLSPTPTNARSSKSHRKKGGKRERRRERRARHTSLVSKGGGEKEGGGKEWLGEGLWWSCLGISFDTFGKTSLLNSNLDTFLCGISHKGSVIKALVANPAPDMQKKLQRRIGGGRKDGGGREGGGGKRKR